MCDPNVATKPEDRKWLYFVGISLALYFGGILLILFVRVIIHLSQSDRKKNLNVEEDFVELQDGIYLKLVELAGILDSAQNFQGKILHVASFILNLTCVAMYVATTSDPIEHCFSIDHTLWKVEVVIYIFFVIHLCIRVFASHDKLSLWSTDIAIIVDLLTMPTIFLPVLFNQYWLGLRFLRAINLTRIDEILQFLNVLKSGHSVEMMSMLGNFLTVWLVSAGMVHLIENTGDPWSPISYQNARQINYFDSTYFLLVTMSTVGYGDITCKTYLGRIFGMMFIGVGLGLFASYLPAISNFFASHTKYNKEFNIIPGKKFVIVCGYITHESVSSFLRDFLHCDRNDNATMVVFLAPSFPDVNIQTSLKKFETRACYFMGTVYSSVDANRVKIKNSDAVIVLCNKKCVNPDEEDAANITRVIAVKNFHERVRCIVQLMMNRNKVHLMNCPQWSIENGDAIICINELKLGFMAQNCNAPGFSSLVGNLFGMRSNVIKEAISECEQWKAAYMLGAANEMYSSYLSNSFVGMTFPQAVELCYEKLNLLLIAIELKTKNGKQFVINPMDKKLRLTRNTRGFFICQNAFDVERALRYCSACHKDLIDPEKMVKCKCRRNRIIVKTAKNKSDDPLNLLIIEEEDEKNNARQLTEDYFPNGEKPKFDQTGTFYWCESRPFEAAKMTLEEAAKENFHNHVVVLVLSNRFSPSLELRQLVLPLRASNNVPNMLKKIVILGNGDFLQKEWLRLANFPDVSVVIGSPYSRHDLRSVNVQTADMCILLSPGNQSAGELEHQALSDKEVILLTLNLKAMQFAADNTENDFQDLLSKNAITLLEKNGVEKNSSESFFQTKPFSVKETSETYTLKIITELIYNTNSMFLDQDDMNIYDDEHFYQAQPYACGSIFTVSVLDSLTYFNGDILTLVQNLVTGSVSSELDELLAEGKQPLGYFETLDIAAVRNRCRISQLDLSDGPLAEFGECGVFGDLFLYALRTYNMICLGLFRLRDMEGLQTKCTKRYVITFPAFNFLLAPTDRVFVLMQFQAIKKKRINFTKLSTGALQQE
ncbi:calcium-activated potassium channel slowpoke isoform X2 [Hydra vulgaris]|uniref:calcium-activated potassium channel slowpoke isoform X2 n=1 Tax=Hydra vulgaris TaxID=6087 RepID=UPI001F5F00B1|nr:calcium-activated potassium channel slowpoke-like isoform X2 [Hydra vulgaris]